MDVAMSLFDLLFLALFLSLVVTAVLAVINVARGRAQPAKRQGRRILWGLGAYFAVIALVSLFSPRRYLAPGEPQCADDWCITVADGHPDSLAHDQYVVHFVLASRARGITQRERFVVAYLQDSTGHRYDAVPSAGDVPFDTALGPLASMSAVRRYQVPAGAVGLGVVITREGGYNFPQCCIIGYDGSLFHKRTIVRLHS
jgi:hypothetical protein